MKFIGYTVVTILLLFVVLAIAGGGESSKDDTSSGAVYYMTKHIITKNLVSPSTADWASINEAKIDRLGDNQFLVTTYVDSQNGFGAMIRTNIVAKMKYDGNEQWRLIAVDTK